MKQAGAWLVGVAPGYQAAIGARELYHLIHEPPSFSVPLAPRHCARVIQWENQLLPVWDLATWLFDAAPAEPIVVAAVVGFQRNRRERARFGALALAAPPVRVQVRDDQACALPAELPAWQAMAVSCFTHQEQAVPIIDLARLFSGALVAGRPASRSAVPMPSSNNAMRKLAVTT